MNVVSQSNVVPITVGRTRQRLLRRRLHNYLTGTGKMPNMDKRFEGANKRLARRKQLYWDAAKRVEETLPLPVVDKEQTIRRRLFHSLYSVKAELGYKKTFDSMLLTPVVMGVALIVASLGSLVANSGLVSKDVYSGIALTCAAVLLITFPLGTWCAVMKLTELVFIRKAGRDALKELDKKREEIVRQTVTGE